MNILVVEDLSDHFEIIHGHLETTSLATGNIDHVKALNLAVPKLEARTHDLALIDLSLIDSDRPETIKVLNSLNTSTAIIVLSSLYDERDAKNLFNGVVQDYISKESLTPELLSRACIHALEKKRYQMLLESKNADMETFCRSLSHDFNGALSHIKTMVTMLSDDLSARYQLTESEQQYVQLLNRSVDTSQSLVKALHSYLSAANPVEHFEPIDLNTLIHDIDQYTKQTCDKNYAVKLGVTGKIFGNRAQLFLMFQNLMTNSIKYNESDPVITFQCSENQEQGVCDIVIHDNGIGMEEKYLERIFLPFQRLHNAQEYAGSGLGLSIVKRIAENHGGKVSVTSKLGEGSCFTITLPNSHSD